MKVNYFTLFDPNRKKRLLSHIINMDATIDPDYIYDQLYSLYRDCQKYETSLIRYHGMRLGRQNFCFTDTRGYRFWVWEYPTWSVYVSNKRGVNFMVLPELDSAQVTQAFDEYLKLVS